MNLDAIQSELRERGLAAWLFYDHHRRDPIAYRILGLPETGLATRRWYYLIPARGTPRKLTHRIEAGALDALPGEAASYARWTELDAGLERLVGSLGPNPKVAMQYSPGCAVHRISLADAGTVEKLRGLGADIVSSGDLISRFDAAWDAGMLASHRAAGRVIHAAIEAAFAEVRRRVEAGSPCSEYELQQGLVAAMRGGGLAVDEPPIVGINEHANDPHFQPAAQGSAPIRGGDLLLLDVFARTDAPGSAFYDVTWMGYCLRPGEREAPARFAETFDLVRRARDAGIALAESRAASRSPLRGFELDQAVRGVIAAAGLDAYFVHRTGHSLGRDVHSTGANCDDYESHDERLVLPGCAFTIEPGIYGPRGEPFGVRSEVNVYYGDGAAEVTGPRQEALVLI
jgi:Xaa-Pro dipeptidase